jgi:hypothetical protein
LTFICLRLLYYRMTLRTEPSDRDVRTCSVASRVDLGIRYVTVCVVSLVAGRSGRKRDNDNKRYTMKVPEHVYVFRDTYTCHTLINYN